MEISRAWIVTRRVISDGKYRVCTTEPLARTCNTVSCATRTEMYHLPAAMPHLYTNRYLSLRWYYGV